MILSRMRRLTHLVVILILLGGLAALVYSSQNKYSQEANRNPTDDQDVEALRNSEKKEDECADGNGDSCEKNEQREKDGGKSDKLSSSADQETIHLAVVACGDRVPETTIMIKSALLFTQAPLHIHIFTEDELKSDFTKALNAWPEAVRKKFHVNLYPISFPGVTNANEWIKLFKPCACQRLFLPYVLQDVERLLYVDTDILFLSPLEDIWSFYKEFNSTHISALAPEHEVPWMGWYNRFARHPFYGPLGVNSGVMLMYLDRMRENSWIDHIKAYFTKYQKRTTWGDQDLINIYFHFFPEQLLVYNCKWNYRPDHCMYGSNCEVAEKEGIKILHGCRGVYHNEKQIVFRTIYEIIRDYQFGEDMQTKLVKLIEQQILVRGKDKGYCSKLPEDFFTKELARHVKKAQTKL